VVPASYGLTGLELAVLWLLAAPIRRSVPSCTSPPRLPACTWPPPGQRHAPSRHRCVGEGVPKASGKTRRSSLAMGTPGARRRLARCWA